MDNHTGNKPIKVYTVDELYDIEKEMRSASEAVICVSELSEEECAYLGVTAMAMSGKYNLTKEQLTIIASLKGEFNKMNTKSVLPKGMLIGLGDMEARYEKERQDKRQKEARDRADILMLGEVAKSDYEILLREFDGTGIIVTLFPRENDSPYILLTNKDKGDARHVYYGVDSTDRRTYRETYVTCNSSKRFYSLDEMCAHPKVRDHFYEMYRHNQNKLKQS